MSSSKGSKGELTDAKFIIIDADPSTREAMGKMLEEFGGKADRPRDPTHARNLLTTTEYDCVLMDKDAPLAWRAAVEENAQDGAPMPLLFLTGPSGSGPPAAKAISNADGYFPRHRDSTRLLAEHIRRGIGKIVAARKHSRATAPATSEWRPVYGSEERFADSKIIVQTQKIPAPGPIEDIVRVCDRGDGRYAILLGDCTFPGKVGELGTIFLRTRIDAYLAESPGPGKLLGDFNLEMLQAGEAIDFMTAVAVLVDLSRMMLTYAVAGHQSPLHRRWGARQWHTLSGTGIPLGIRAGEKYREYSRKLRAGDKILLISDGILKMKGARGGFKNGDAPLRDIDLMPMDAAPREILEGINDLVASVTGGDGVADEITATLIQV